jgi:hypothetical protein
MGKGIRWHWEMPNQICFKYLKQFHISVGDFQSLKLKFGL